MTTSASSASSASSRPFCPACGHNLVAEAAVAIGPLEFDPRADVHWHGRRVSLTCAQFLTFGALVQAGGQIVSKDVLAERAGYDGDGDTHDVVQVLVSRIRRALRSVGAPVTMIGTDRGRGYRLDVELIRQFDQDTRA